MLTTPTEPHEHLKRIQSWYRQTLPNILPNRNLTSFHGNQSAYPKEKEKTELTSVASEFSPNFNVYLHNGTRALHIKLQHPSFGGMGTLQHDSPEALDELKSLAARFISSNRAKIPEPATVKPPSEDFYK